MPDKADAIPVIRYVYVYPVDEEWHAVSNHREHIRGTTPHEALYGWLYNYGPADERVPVRVYQSKFNHWRPI